MMIVMTLFDKPRGPETPGGERDMRGTSADLILVIIMAIILLVITMMISLIMMMMILFMIVTIYI